MKQIADPLYDGYTVIEDDELPVLDSEPVQRLRRVNQLGLSSQVYPGATHSRFIHSLGVLRLASQFAETMDIDEHTRKVARLAGLLHDVGHGPYSHAIESAFPDFPDHEYYSEEIVDQLEADGVLPVSADAIKQQIRGEAEVPIIAGDIDADRIDYLNRDAKFTGNRLGTVEHHTLIDNARHIDGEIVFHRNAVEALEGMLLARKNMIGSVYQHPTARIAERMLQEALEYYDEKSPEEIIRFDDSQLHAALMNADDNRVRQMYQNIVQRNLYKNAFELRDSDMSETEREAIESLDIETFHAEIAAGLDVEPHEILVDVQHESTSKLNINIIDDGEISPISRYSSIESMLDAPNDVMRIAVYTPPEYRSSVESPAKDYLYRNDILNL